MTTSPTPPPQTPPPSTPPPRPDGSPTPPAEAGAPVGLTARAIAAHQLARRHDPDGYPRRHDDWRTWARRQHGAAALAGVLGVPVSHVGAGDDVDRGYGINRQPETCARGTAVLPGGDHEPTQENGSGRQGTPAE